MRHWTPNQKLTQGQIATIKFLKSSGVQLSIIATVLEQRYGVSKCTAYYHASENRDAYDAQIKKEKALETLRIKEKIHTLVKTGMNTQEIAQSWNMPLATVNKIYIK